MKSILHSISLIIMSVILSAGFGGNQGTDCSEKNLSPKTGQEKVIKSDERGITLEDFRKAEETLGNPESECYNEEEYCKVLKDALNCGILNEADRMRAGYRLEVAKKNRPGKKAADFRLLLRGPENKISNLHSLSAEKPVLLLFYDPDCDHCMQTISEIENSNLPDRTQIVAIYAEDDKDRWIETAGNLPESWTVGYAIDPIQDEETYVFLSSPTIFLLDSKKRVILKDTTLPMVEKILDSLQGKASPHTEKEPGK